MNPSFYIKKKEIANDIYFFYRKNLSASIKQQCKYCKVLKHAHLLMK